MSFAEDDGYDDVEGYDSEPGYFPVPRKCVHNPDDFDVVTDEPVKGVIEWTSPDSELPGNGDGVLAALTDGSVVNVYYDAGEWRCSVSDTSLRELDMVIEFWAPWPRHP
jgi:hypothetical protein